MNFRLDVLSDTGGSVLGCEMLKMGEKEKFFCT
jgi:hypothetical protein